MELMYFRIDVWSFEWITLGCLESFTMTPWFDPDFLRLLKYREELGDRDVLDVFRFFLNGLLLFPFLNI